MWRAGRREFLAGAAATSAAFTLRAGSAQATLLRGLPLPVLVLRSGRVVVLEPLEAVCRYALIGGRRSIVTDTQVAVHHSWHGNDRATQLTLRTLGGRLDGVGELVHGQPLLELGVRGVGFLKWGREGDVWWTTGMAQGHYPLTGAGDDARLLADRQLPTLVNLQTSAVKQLVGRRRSEAEQLVRQAVQR